jgi:hypothetical protein
MLSSAAPARLSLEVSKSSELPQTSSIVKRIRIILVVLAVALFAPHSSAGLLFSTGAVWNLFKGRTEASTPNTTAWRSIAFNDSAFTTAPAPFWYGDAQLGGTQLTDMQNHYSCIFLRRTFVLTNLTEFSALRLSAFVDDGFVVWINGTEVQRVNVGTSGSAVSISTLAGLALEPPPLVSYDLPAPNNYLVLGTNVIAVQVFNISLGSSDFGFDCSFGTTAPDLMPPLVASIEPAPGLVNNLTQVTVTFNEPVSGVEASDFLINGLPAVAMTGGNDTYSFAFAQPAFGKVTISWRAGHAIADYGTPPNPFNATAPAATWQYQLVDNIPPTVASQLPLAGVTVRSLSQIEVNFGEAVTGVDAADLLINNVPATSVSAITVSRYVFTFSPPTAGPVLVRFTANHDIRDRAATPNNFGGASWNYVLDPTALLDAVRLNELAAANVNGLRDEDNEVQDWVEFYNPADASVSLAGWSFSDDQNAPTKWVFPAVTLGPRGYLLVFCSGKDRRTVTPGVVLHTNFKLDLAGEFLGLYNAEVPRRLVSSFNPYPNQSTDYSWGRDPLEQMKYFQTQTPGASNGVSAIAGIVADIQFSHQHGFYTNPFSLSLTCATAAVTVRYTTNGAVPTATSGRIYSAPIPIDQTTVVRAAAYRAGSLPSKVEARTFLFLNDVIRQSTNGTAPPGWPATWGANVVDYGMDPDIVNAAAYKDTIQSDLQAIPSFSIVADLDDLFGANGIYSNPGGDTRTWERPCSIELIYPDDTEGFQINCGIRLRGGFSRDISNPKHAFRFFFREEYGAAKLNYPFFGPTAVKSFDNFDLRTMQNLSWSFQGDSRMMCLRDVASRDAQLAINGLGTHGNFFHLYINGQYWGLYNSEERPEASFAAAYVGGNPDDYDVIKQLDGYTSGATDGNVDAWYRLWLAATNGFASDEEYFKVQGLNVDGTPNAAFENLVDVTNLIDYMLVILYSGNYDAPISAALGNDYPNNWYGFRDRTGNHGGFRFISHDAESSLLSTSADRTGIVNLANTIPPNTYGVIDPDWTCGNPLTQIGGPAEAIRRSTPQYIWFRMHQNAEFRMQVADRAQKHCFNGGPLSVLGMKSSLLTRSNEIQRAIVGESARWGDAKRAIPFTRNDWVSAMNAVINPFVNYRTPNLINQLRADGLFPVSVNAPLLSSFGGAVASGFALYLTNNNVDGMIYYTLNGTDPRLRGGNSSGSAIADTPGTPIVINFPTTVRARVRSGTIWSAIVEATFYPAQDLSRLIFTEINYHPPGGGTTSGDDFEFVELKNSGPAVIDLSGLSFTSGITFTFTNGTRLNPGQFLVLGSNPTALLTRYPGLVVSGRYTGRLDNGGERLAMSHPLDTVVMVADYKDSGRWPRTPDGLGYSLVAKDPNANPEPGNPASWRASSYRYGSPGADDPPTFLPGILVNEALCHTDPPSSDSIELYNPTTAEVDIGGWFLTDDGKYPWKYRVPLGTTISAGGYLLFSANDFSPVPGTTNNFLLSSYGEEVYLFSGGPNTNLTGYSHGFTFGASENGVSIGRYVLSTGDEHFVAQRSPTLPGANSGPRVGPVVIRQIMYHPPDLAGDLDNVDDEFIELRNITEAPVPLYDPAFPTNYWRVRGGVGFDFPTNTTLSAHESVFLISFSPTNAAMLATFRSKYGFAGVPVYGPYGGKLDNSSDTIEVQRPDAPDTNGVAYILVDKVNYQDVAPWPASADGGGAAVCRLDDSAYGNDPANWVDYRSLTIGVQPQGGNVRVGSSVNFRVSAFGTGALTYQWQKDGTNLVDATDLTLILPSVQLADQGLYTVRVRDDSSSVVSIPAVLIILEDLQIIHPPLDQEVVAGSSVTLSAEIAGNPPPFTYEWRTALPPVVGVTVVSDSRTTFHTAILTSNTTWQLAAKNLASPAGVAATANITVLPDADGDGLPDAWERRYGLNPASALDASLDKDGDGMRNTQEYDAGTDPNDAASYLKVQRIATEVGGATISFLAQASKTYTVLCRDSITENWQRLADIPADTSAHTTHVTDPGPLSNRFYRLVTPRMPASPR